MYFKTLTVQLIFVISLVALVTSCDTKKSTPLVSSTDSIANIVAIKEASVAIERDPKNAEMYYRRAVSYFNLKYLDRALIDMNDAIKLNDQNPLYQFYKGKVCYAMNKTLDAEKAYLSAVVLKPDYTESQMALGELYYIVKKHTESVNQLNNVLAITPDNTEAHFLKGMNFKEMGDTAKSIASFQKALEFDNNNYNAAIQLGRIFTERGDKAAYDYLTAAIKMQKRNTEGYFARAYYFQKTGQFQKALFDYRKVVDIDPSSDLAYYNVGCINFDVKQYKEAQRSFNICIQMNNQNTRAYYMRGLIHEIEGNLKEARLNYEYALELEPEFGLAKERLNHIK